MDPEAMERQVLVPDGVKAACIEDVLMIFEDMDHQHLEDLAQEHLYNSDAVIAAILDRQDRSLPYPRRANNLKRKRSEIADEDNDEPERPKIDVEAKIDDPDYIDQMRSMVYRDMATLLISQDFPTVPKTTIKSKLLSRNGSSLFRTYIAMDQATRNWDESNPMWTAKKSLTKPLPQYSVTTIQNVDRDGLSGEQCAALNEFIAAREVKAVRDVEKAAAVVEQQNLEQARRDGEMGECGCCFEEFPLNRMVQCEGAAVHLFCRACMRQQAETTIGYSKYVLTCLSMDGCSEGFSAAQKEKFLDKKLQVALNRIEAQAMLEAAGIENLETCPFCPMAMEYPPIEENREFRCTNPSCEKISCRLCRKLTHIPKTCAEAATEEGHSARHIIEEAMSEAIIRKCNKCSNPYIKQDGCNKIHCTRCGTLQCYVCRQTVTDYSHFNDKNRGGKSGQCPLFEQTETRHQDEVRRAEESSRLKVVKDNPEVDGDIFKVKMSNRVQEDEKMRKVGDIRPGPRVGIDRVPPNMFRRAPPPIPDGLRANALELFQGNWGPRHQEHEQRIHEIRERYRRLDPQIRERHLAEVEARLVAIKRTAQWQNQQAQVHRDAAQQLFDNYQIGAKVLAARNNAPRPEVPAVNVAQAALPQRLRGLSVAGRNAVNPIILDRSLVGPETLRNLREDNVFKPLRMGSDLNMLGRAGEPLQQLLNTGLGPPPDLGLFRLGDFVDLEVANRAAPPPARGGVRQTPASQTRAQPGARLNQQAAPHHVRDARA